MLRRLPLSNTTLVIEIEERTTGRLGDGGALWDAGIELGDFLVSRVGGFQGSKVVELGSGTGHVAIVAAALGAALSIATDLPGEPLELLQANCERNSETAASCIAMPLDWNSEADAEAVRTTAGSSGVDFIIGADVSYLDEFCEPLLKTILHLGTATTCLYFCHKHRPVRHDGNYDDGAAFPFEQTWRAKGVRLVARHETSWPNIFISEFRID